jgi:RNA polymerase sigma-70 factor (ECF subfamily)
MKILFGNRDKKTPDLSVLSDAELIKHYKEQDDVEAVGVLFKRYSHLAYGVSLKYLKNADNAQDAVMEIFDKMMTDLKNHDISNFKSWLYSVSKNWCLMELRKVKHIQPLNNYSFETFSDEFMDSGNFLHLDNNNDPNDRIQKMMEALNKLNHDQKTCIELVYLQQKSYNEVTQITGYDMKQVKSHIQNGKRNLKILLTSK